MKKILFGLIPVAALALLALKPFSNELPIGSQMPKADIKMKDISGKEVTLKDAVKKNGILVMFSCNTCPVVKQYQARTNEICKYALSKDIGVVLLNSNEALRSNGDSYDDMKSYAGANNYTWNYAVDNNSTLADAFGATRTPECFLFNKDSKLVYHGAIDDNANGPDESTRRHLKIAVDELVQGKEISKSESRSVGCNIKRKAL